MLTVSESMPALSVTSGTSSLRLILSVMSCDLIRISKAGLVFHPKTGPLSCAWYRPVPAAQALLPFASSAASMSDTVYALLYRSSTCRVTGSSFSLLLFALLLVLALFSRAPYLATPWEASLFRSVSCCDLPGSAAFSLNVLTVPRYAFPWMTPITLLIPSILSMSDSRLSKENEPGEWSENTRIWVCGIACYTLCLLVTACTNSQEEFNVMAWLVTSLLLWMLVAFPFSFLWSFTGDPIAQFLYLKLLVPLWRMVSEETDTPIWLRFWYSFRACWQSYRRNMLGSNACILYVLCLLLASAVSTSGIIGTLALSFELWVLIGVNLILHCAMWVRTFQAIRRHVQRRRAARQPPTPSAPPRSGPAAPSGPSRCGSPD